MLAVRLDQVSTLGLYERAQFIKAVFRMLAERFTEEAANMSIDAVMVLIDRGISLAATYEIVLEPDVLRFLELLVGLGEDFVVRPDCRWITEALSRIDLLPSSKLDLIVERLAFGEP